MRFTVVLLFITCCFAGCKKEDTSPLGRYKSALEQGLEAERGPEETVLGIELGMSDQQFYDRCTELNRQQLVTMGGGSNLVDHYLANDLDRPATLTFRPKFLGENPRRIQAMEITVIYEEWAPWNKSAYADKLLPEVVDYFNRTLGIELQQVHNPLYGTTYFSVEGYRLLALWVKDDSMVTGIITDLSTISSDPLGLVQ